MAASRPGVRGIGFFGRRLARSETGSPEQRVRWRTSVYAEIGAQAATQGKLTVEQMCWLAPVSRAGYYRGLKEGQPEEEEVEVRGAIREIALGHHRRYGYRRIAAEPSRRGLQVNHKRVVRLMREDNLLAIRHRRYVVATDSQHEPTVYLNLAKRMRLTAAHQLWVADPTYIRLNREFVYLAE